MANVLQSKSNIIFFGVISICIMAFLVIIGDAWLGWSLVLFFILFSPFCSGLMKLDSKESQVFILIMCCHVAMAILCFYLLPQVAEAFGGRDSNAFISIALKAQPYPFYPGVGAYVNFLKIIAVISPAPFSFDMISLVAVAAVCLLLVKILGTLEIRNHSSIVLIVATLIPTDIILTSIALRELWQVLFFVSSAYFSLCLLNASSGKMVKSIGLILSLIFLGCLHKGLVYIAFMWPFVFFGSYLALKFFDRIDMVLKIAFILLFLGVVCAVLAHLADQFKHFTNIALNYSTLAADGGASYTLFFKSNNGFVTNLLHLPLALLYYWFYPFPWDIHRVKDVYGCLIGLLRLFFIVYSFYFVLTSDKAKQRYFGGALLMLLLLTSLVFSIGTSNYGTSLRHNILTFWGFVALGVSGFYLHRYRRYCRRVGQAK